MFFPQAMTEIELIVPEKDLLAVTKALAGRGVVHQVDVSHMSAEARGGQAESWKERAAIYSGLERQIQLIMQALSMPESAPPADDESTVLELETVRPVVGNIEAELKEVNASLAALHKELERLEKSVQQLEPVADLNLDLSALRRPSYIHAILGIMPVANMERLRTSLSRIPYVLVPLREDRKNSVVWLTGAKGNSDILDRAARSAYVDPLDLGTMEEGSPSELIARLQERIKSTNAEIETQRAALTQLRDRYGAQLEDLLWKVRTSRLLADAMGRYGKLRYTYLIVGWVPSAKLPALSEDVRRISSNIVLEATPFRRRGDSTQNVPVALRNPGLLGAFQGLVTTYARPRYEEIDPTILMAITFPLLFGAMFGDVGHGLLLTLFGILIASRRVRALRSLAGLGTILTACGVVSIIFGFVYGSIFGVESLRPLGFRPMESITEILLIAIGAGIVILSLGFILNIVNAARAQDWGRLLFDPHGIAGLVLYWSLLAFGAAAILPKSPVSPAVPAATAALGALGVMFSELLRRLVDGHRPLIEGSIGLYLFQAAVELFENLISLLSNTLSYVRVGAFAVAHAGLSSAIFILGALVSPTHGIGYLIVAVLGNLFIAGFEGLIVGIQTLRLEYYEFFGKFFTGGGMSYEPLSPLPSARNDAERERAPA